ncbi:MAG: hypothetical protein WCB68_12525 [Pyrinomonadaceae bacterium]
MTPDQVALLMTEAAMDEAIRLGLFPSEGSFDAYARRWTEMQKVLKAALTPRA